MAINQHPEVLLYSRIRQSPYFYASRRHGVQRYSFYNHMYHPRHYGDPVEEYWQLLNGVTLWDVGVERQPRKPGCDFGGLNPSGMDQLSALTDHSIKAGIAEGLTACDAGRCHVRLNGGEFE